MLGLIQACAVLNLFAHGAPQRFEILPKHSHMFFLADLSMARHQGVKVQRFNLFQRLDPVVGECAISDRLDRNKIDGEQQVALWQQHHEAVVRVVLAGIDQLDLFAAQVDGHVVSEGQVRPRSAGICRLKNFGPREGVTYELRRSGKDAAAGNVVIVVMAVYDIAHRLIGELLDFGFQSGRGIEADRVGHDYPIRRDDEDGLMRLMSEEVHIFAQLGDLISWARLLGGDGEERNRRKRRMQRKENYFERNI